MNDRLNHTGFQTLLLVLLGLLVVVGAGCATQAPGPTTTTPGFLLGICHGSTAPFAFIMSWFLDVRLYAYPNAGVIYDAGYLAGLSLWTGIIWR